MNRLLAILFIAGLLLAGSDGPMFPWPNLAGIGLIGMFVALVGLKGDEA